MRINAYFHILHKELTFYGIKIIQFSIRRPIAFNGVRAKKMRRV